MALHVCDPQALEGRLADSGSSLASWPSQKWPASDSLRDTISKQKVKSDKDQSPCACARACAHTHKDTRTLTHTPPNSSGCWMFSEYLIEFFPFLSSSQETLTVLALSPDFENWCFTLRLRNGQQDIERPNDFHLKYYGWQNLSLNMGGRSKAPAASVISKGAEAQSRSILLLLFQGDTALTCRSPKVVSEACCSRLSLLIIGADIG